MLSRGTELDHYLLEGPLGAGGMGEVYAAMDTMLHRRVALKLLPMGSAGDKDARARMIREARAASALRHPGIVTIYGFGEDDGRTYIAMELVEGENFSQLVARRGKLPPREAVDLVAKVGEALDAAHRAGILHRDVKSANLMLEPNGHVKVLDFGLSKRLGGPVIVTSDTPTPTPAPRSARPEPKRESNLDPEATTMADTNPTGTPEAMTAAGTRMGTPAYSAPELWEGLPVDKRCDVFSLGVVLYELLVGRRPFAADGESDVRAAIDDERFVAPSDEGLDPRFDEVMERALAAKASERYASVPELIAGARAAVRRGVSRWWWAAAVAPLLAGGGVAAYVSQPISLPSPELPRPAAPASSAITVVPRRLTSTDACASTPTFIYGDSIVYELWAGSDIDLEVTTFSGGPPRRLVSSPSWDFRPHAVSTNNTRIYYSQVDVSATDGRGTSRVVEVDALTGTTLWSKPLVALGVASGPDSLYYVRPTGRQIRRLTSDGESVVVDLPPHVLAAQITSSRDGSMIAFAPEMNLPVALCLVTVADGKVDCIPRQGIFAARPAFSPDGRHVYYASTRGIRRYTIATKADESVVPTVWAQGGISVSKDGGALAYSDCAAVGPIREVSAKGEPIFLDEPRPGGLAGGTRGAMAWYRHFPDGDIIMYRDSSGSLRQLTDTSIGLIGHLRFDPSGAWLAFASSLDGGEGLYVVGTENGVPVRRVTDDPTDNFPVWWGQRLVFTRSEKDPMKTQRLWSVAADGSDLKLLSADYEAAYAANAQGELLALKAKRERVEWWNPTTGKRREGPPFELEGMGVSHTAFSPSGAWFLLGVGGGQRFYRLDLRKPQLTAEVVSDGEGGGAGVHGIDDDGRVYLQRWQWKGNLYGVSLPLAE